MTPIRKPTYVLDRPGLDLTLICQSVETEISPEPSEEERAAILAALADGAEKAAPAPWEPEEPESP